MGIWDSGQLSFIVKSKWTKLSNYNALTVEASYFLSKIYSFIWGFKIIFFLTLTGGILIMFPFTDLTLFHKYAQVPSSPLSFTTYISQNSNLCFVSSCISFLFFIFFTFCLPIKFFLLQMISSVAPRLSVCHWCSGQCEN